MTDEDKRLTTKDKLKELLRYRTTLEKGLTIRQIYWEIYPQEEDPHDYDYYERVKYLKNIMRHLRRTDDDFRWLSLSMPIKLENAKKPPFVEYRYINIKASQTPELLEQINAYWYKREMAIAQ